MSIKKIFVLSITIAFITTIFITVPFSKVSANESSDEQLTNGVVELMELVEYSGLDSGDELTEEIQVALKKQIEKTITQFENENNVSDTNFSQSDITLLASPLTDKKVNDYFVKNYKQARQIRADYEFMKKVSLPTATQYRNSIFVELVRSGGAWDIKRPLGSTKQYNFRGWLRTGEYLGNAHYGYLGKHVGYGNTTLKTAAGFYQILSLTSDKSFYKSYFDDPKDTIAIQAGINLYNNNVIFKP